jgi:hypothetical protein
MKDIKKKADVGLRYVINHSSVKFEGLVALILT